MDRYAWRVRPEPVRRTAGSVFRAGDGTLRPVRVENCVKTGLRDPAGDPASWPQVAQTSKATVHARRDTHRRQTLPPEETDGEKSDFCLQQSPTFTLARLTAGKRILVKQLHANLSFVTVLDTLVQHYCHRVFPADVQQGRISLLFLEHFAWKHKIIFLTLQHSNNLNTIKFKIL